MPGALSHQIRGLAPILCVELSVRKPRAIVLTDAGRRLHPRLQTGFGLIRQSVEAVMRSPDDNTLLISTPPGVTAKWLAPRLWRFLAAPPGIDARVSSTPCFVELIVGAVDVAGRNRPIGSTADPALPVE